jgi:phosphogluconate dehydratase
MIRLDAANGRLDVLMEQHELDTRMPVTADLSSEHSGMGRDLFGLFRQASTTADMGAGVL